MAKVRVPVANTAGKSVRINSDATVGATIGQDLRLPDGTVPTLTELAAALALGSVQVQGTQRSDEYIYWNQILGNYDFIQFDTSFSGTSEEGKLQWNTDDGTLEFGLPGGNVTIQIGQEHVIRVRNTTGVQIDNGSVVYIVGAQGNKPLIGLADADTIATARVIAVATEDIGHNSFGYVTTAGLVRDVNTNGMAVGSDLWLSSTAGEFQVAEPTAPAAAVFVGHVMLEHTNNGVILVAITPDARVRLDDLDLDLQANLEINFSVALDQPDVSASSNGSTITLTLEKVGGGDVRFMFSDGVHDHDCTDPIASTALTPGTDTSPQINYVYILQSTKALTVSTAGWPAAEHAPLATVLCQTAASAQTDGVYKMHAWTDHTWNGETGHLAHLNFWIRNQPATWRSGTLCTPSVGAATFDLAVASGSVLQLHPHAFPAFDTSTGSEVMIVNQNGTPYDRVGNMVSQITDASGGSMSGSYYNLVVWGVVSEDSADCQLMVNLPTASYNSSAKATLDADATTVYDIPTDFIGTGFLIARLVCRHQVSGNTYSIVSNIDLRGTKPSTSAGGTVGGGVTSLGDLSDVDSTGFADGFVLTSDASGNATWEARGVSELGDLSDADPTGFSNNDLMYWSGGVLVDTGGLLTWDGTELAIDGNQSFGSGDQLKWGVDTVLTADAGDTDPDFANVSLLLPMSGADAATATTDISNSGHTATFVGDAQIDTAQKKFETGSLLMDGTGDWLTIPDHADWAFGAGDFTVECHVRFNTVPASGLGDTIVSQYEPSSSQRSWFLRQFNVSGVQKIIFGYSVNGSSLVQVMEDFTPIVNTWYHYAVSRNGSDLRMFVDGVQKGSTHNIGSSTLHDSTWNLTIGALGNSSTPDDPSDGWFDELRITKGVGRYSANFTPPTAAYLTDVGDKVASVGHADYAMTVLGTSVDIAQDLQVVGDVGFYDTPAVAQQTGVAVTDVAIHAALVNLGLITA